MMSKSTKPKVVLLVGGHAHALCVRELGLHCAGYNGLKNSSVLLISDVLHAPYSGMLPGMIAGEYSYDDAHIDLSELTKFAGVSLILSKCTGIDLSKREVQLQNGKTVAFDFLSINIGSTHSQKGVPGTDAFAIPVKPVSEFLKSWESLLEELKSGRHIEIIVVGGGAGGVELVLSMKRRLGNAISITLLTQDCDVLATHNQGVRRLIRTVLSSRNITVHTDTKVEQVFPHRVVDSLGNEFSYSHLFWVTSASAPEWIRNSGLALDCGGFVKVNSYLQSTSHPFVFAAGDIASMVDTPRPKSGVFAVKQAKPLLTNIEASLTETSLTTYRPQGRFLNLIGTGDGCAVVSWGHFAWYSRSSWYVKHFIDRRFMRKFQGLKGNSLHIRVIN